MPGESDLYTRFGRDVDAGRAVFREGEEGDQMFIIQAGRVKVVRSIAGKEQILAVLGKGDFFGEMALLTKTKRTATVMALEPVRLLAFDREGFLNMINKNPKIALNVIDKLCRRLQHANLHIQHLARKDPKGLIAMNLKFAFQSAGADAAGQAGGLLWDRTVDEFSQNLEITQEQVRAALEDLARRGVLEVAGNTITLLDADRLDAIAE
jgi:CRP/FNR family cyclic AMP-dependent transcriptional regulator